MNLLYFKTYLIDATEFKDNMSRTIGVPKSALCDKISAGHYNICRFHFLTSPPTQPHMHAYAPPPQPTHTHMHSYAASNVCWDLCKQTSQDSTIGMVWVNPCPTSALALY